MRRAAAAADQGPSDEGRLLNAQTFGHLLNNVIDPQDPTNVSFPFLRRMRRHHGVAFAMHLIRTPHIKTSFYFEAESAQVAAFADNLIRPIYGGLMLTILRMLDYGYSPAAQNREVVFPAWTYMEDGQVKKVWSNNVVGALVPKPLVPLRPESCRLSYDQQGRWSGILWDSAYSGKGNFFLGGINEPQIDLIHAVWATHDYEAEDGSPYGHARMALCAPIFHMYRWLWTLMGRAFENNADPGPTVGFPEDDGQVPEGDLTNQETALLIGKRKRSGSHIAIPSKPYSNYANDRTTAVPQWFIEYVKNETDFHSMQGFLGYLDAMIFRCVTADTPIDCPRDYNKYPDGIPISELKEGQLIWCFNEIKEEFQLLPVKRVGSTRPNAELLELTLDTGKKIRATPDHKFMRRDGTWSELKDLKPGDSLMPLERDFEPYVKVKPNDRGWNRTPRVGRECDLVAEASLGTKDKGINLHHVDDRHINTSAENLEYLTGSSHAILTNTGTRRRPDQYDRIRSGYQMKICNDCGVEFLPRGPTSSRCDPCQGQAAFRSITQRQRQVSTSRIINIPTKLCGSCKKSYAPSGNAQKYCEDCRSIKYLQTRANPISQEEWRKSLSNHKVLAVERCNNREDTWDLSVDGPPECHSFVSQGVVLHNSLLIPEQSAINSSGSSSSRNVVKNLSSQRDTSQIVLMQQIMDGVIMDQIVRPAMAMNMPWYEGRLEMKTLGFGQDDEDIVRQIFQLVGQQDYKTFGIDLRRLADSKGFPMIGDKEFVAELQRRQDQAAQISTGGQPPPVQPTQGRRALVTQTGFADADGNAQMMYVQVSDPIDLASTADGDFVVSLPQTETWQEPGVVDAARTLRNKSETFLSWAYRDAAIFVSKREVFLHLDEVDLADEGRIKAAVGHLVSLWTPDPDKVSGYLSSVKRALGRAYDRTASSHLRRLRSSAKVSQLDQTAAQWLDEQGARLVTGVMQTTRDQLASFMADRVAEGKTTKEIANDIRSHFASFPLERSTTIARTEIGSAYLHATVTTGIAAGVKKVQLLDGTGDECRERNGRIINIQDAYKEQLSHPNCQLRAVLLPNAPDQLEVERTTLDGEHLALYDEDAHVVLLSSDLTPEQETEFMLALGSRFAVVS